MSRADVPGYQERLIQSPLWRRGLLQAFGVSWSRRAPEVGDLMVAGATDTKAGSPRRIVSVVESERDDRAAWIVEHTALDAEPTTSERAAIGFWQNVGWPRLPEHFPICGRCHELMPCQHVVIDHIATHSADEMERFSDPSICPACLEPVTLRQKAITFDRNLHGFGTVTFHLRKKCVADARVYDRNLHREDGDFQLNCPGAFRSGVDEDGVPVTYCTELHCRGADRHHMRGGIHIAGYINHPDGFYRQGNPAEGFSGE